MKRLELPSPPGSYRWYYVDVEAGDFTAVVIFMVGSVFSPRYSSSLRRGGEPREHAAVNFALYEKGARCQWVLTEYQRVSLEEDGRCLRVGRSALRHQGGGLLAEIVDKTPVWGRPAQVRLELLPDCPPTEPVRLVEGMSHWWDPIAPRARAVLEIPLLGLRLEGRAYHDGNHGDVPLGSDLPGWDWKRVHDGEHTTIVYRPWYPAAPEQRRVWHLRAGARACQLTEGSPEPADTTRTLWGLRVPQRLLAQGEPFLLESSPFYARLEASQEGAHAMAEVADFRRFHSPWIRWMARLRTRIAQPERRAS